MICDFGKNKDGVNLYRINGGKNQIQKAIDELTQLGCEIWTPYEFERVGRGDEFTVLLKVQIPEMEVEQQ
jgi:hypothetical protein